MSLPPTSLCICTRDTSQLHCPHCGYATVRALPSRKHDATWPDGTQHENNVFCCRKCGRYFDDITRLFHCEAPAPRLGRKADALRAKRVTEVLTPDAIASAAESNIAAKIQAQGGVQAMSQKDSTELMRQLWEKVHGGKQ